MGINLQERGAPAPAFEQLKDLVRLTDAEEQREFWLNSFESIRGRVFRNDEGKKGILCSLRREGKDVLVIRILEDGLDMIGSKGYIAKLAEGDFRSLQYLELRRSDYTGLEARGFAYLGNQAVDFVAECIQAGEIVDLNLTLQLAPKHMPFIGVD